MESRIFVVSTKSAVSSLLVLEADDLRGLPPFISSIEESDLNEDLKWFVLNHGIKLYKTPKYLFINMTELRGVINDEIQMNLNLIEMSIKKYKETGNYEELEIISDLAWPQTGFLFFYNSKIYNAYGLLNAIEKDEIKLYILKAFAYQF